MSSAYKLFTFIIFSAELGYNSIPMASQNPTIGYDSSEKKCGTFYHVKCSAILFITSFL